MPASLGIVIFPPFYAAWWFKALGPLLALLAVLIFIKIRTYRVHARNEELERRIKDRTKELFTANKRAEEQYISAEEANKDGTADRR